MQTWDTAPQEGETNDRAGRCARHMLHGNVGTDCFSLARARRSKTMENGDALSDLEALVLMLLVGDALAVEEILELERIDRRDGVKPGGQ
jgi:hypothetical protein